MRGVTFASHGSRQAQHVSTHTPHAGRDRIHELTEEYDVVFQPTRPMRGVTIALHEEAEVRVVSTHTPHAGRDL